MLKSLFTPISLLLALIVSMCLYQTKFGTVVTGLDEVRTALNSLKTGIPADNRVDVSVHTQQPEMICWLGNAWAPSTMITTQANLDTTLFVFDAGITDSAITATLMDRQKLQQAGSAHYVFILATNR